MFLPPVDDACAFFFDVDGTLADIAADAASVRLDADLPAVLLALACRAGGALAVVSGRPIEQIDRLLHPAALAAAGVHGVERRDAAGRVTRLDLPDLAPAAAWVQAWCDRHPGARLEHKPGALALHYRGADALEAPCLAVMAQARDRVASAGLALMHGKKVVELKPAAADKGRAVHAFMAEPPFTGRRPWYFGDDVTDEHAFDAVQALGGVTVKVGPGATLAAHRLPDPDAVRQWLRALVAGGAASGRAVPTEREA